MKRKHLVQAAGYSPEDIGDIAKIEQQCTDDPKSRRWFSQRLLPEDTVCGAFVAKYIDTGRPVGFIVYECDVVTGTINILRLAVLPDERRKHYGSMLVNQVIVERVPGINEVSCLVPEEDLALHLFFKSLGFKASLKRQPWKKKESDGYLFTWKAAVKV